MELSKKNKQQEHIESIFKEYTTPSRVLRSFTNLSNTVIQTALSGQSKFVFEILQNADDAFEDQHKAIEVKFIIKDNYLIVHHNGKGFDSNDVERICDYASQIEEVKAIDLSKTGYKGLGFKSLFNLSDCIYIYSNGYSFRFDKAYLPDAESKPWQVIPIWCEYHELPLHEKYSYNQPVNLILRVNDINQLEVQLRELIDQPELLLYLFRIDKFSVNLNGEEYLIERRVEKYGVFNKIDFHKNQLVASTWLSRTYEQSVPAEVHTFVQGANRFIYPDKIKNAKQIPFTFSVRSDQTLRNISKVRGLCYSTLPTQLHLTLPYHINSLFILNLDRTQLHENEWNEFLLYQIGHLQLSLLKDLAEVNYLKNYVIVLLVREIGHPYNTFCRAFMKGFIEAKGQIGWLPAHQGPRLLKLGEVWIDEIEFFKQNFERIEDRIICPNVIDYAVKSQSCLCSSKMEVEHFTYGILFRDFPNKYYHQLTRAGYISFITYLYERLKGPPANTTVANQLRSVHFLKAKDGKLLTPASALLEESQNPIPNFLLLNPIDNEYLPSKNANLIKDWLVLLGARWLKTPIQMIRESILQWVDLGNFKVRITLENHIGIINFLAKGMEELTMIETEKLKKGLFILTQGNQFKLANSCYLPDAVSTEELADIIISDDDKISFSYDLKYLRKFFIRVGVRHKLNLFHVFRENILMWIRSGQIRDKLTISNYKPIVEYVASHYPAVEYRLTEQEIDTIKMMPVLTSGQVFQEARVCYFDSAIPKVKGLEGVISKTELVSTNNISYSVLAFLTKMGVSKKIDLVDVLRRSVLRWIQKGDIANRITIENHHAILKYIANLWCLFGLRGLKPEEIIDLKRIPLLTRSMKFRPACSCYWPTNLDVRNCIDIPMLDSIICSDELVSSDYDSKDLKKLLSENLGVRNLTFTDIYEKYSDNLTRGENVKWFFSELVSYWEKYKLNNKDNLLICLQQKLKTSSRLLAKNGKMYSSTELYSSRFDTMHDIDKNSVPLLDYEKLPVDLERWLGFKTTLDLKCITQVLEAFQTMPILGEEGTRIFFTTLLEQLRLKDRSEIKKYQLSLLSNENKLVPAEDLYYFIEEDATCVLVSCYLKRIHGMSHAETSELAELCGVHTMPFKQEVTREEEETYDNTLKEFYLQRLPFIVIQESRQLNENPSTTLRRLYDAICTIKLHKCLNIYVQYPFGNPVKIQHHFKDLTFYTIGTWKRKKTKIHKHLREELQLKTDIEDIIDMEEPISQDDKQEWLSNEKEEDQTKFYLIVEELRKLFDEGKEEINRSRGQEHLGDGDAENEHLGDGDTANEHLGGGDTANEHLGNSDPENEHLGAGDTENEHLGTFDTENEHLGTFDTENEHLGTFDTENEHLGAGDTENKMRIASEFSSNETFVKSVVEPCNLKQHVMTDEDSGVYDSLLREPEETSHYEISTDSKLENITEINSSSMHVFQKRLSKERKQVISESGKDGQPHESDNKEKHLKDSEENNKNLIFSESSTNKSSVYSVEDEGHGVHGSFLHEPEFTGYESTTGSKLENIIEVDSSSIQVLQKRVFIRREQVVYESEKMYQPYQSGNKGKHFKGSETENKNRNTSEYFTNKCSVDSAEDESSAPMQHAIKDEGTVVSGTFVREPEAATRDSTTGSKLENIIEVLNYSIQVLQELVANERNVVLSASEEVDQSLQSEEKENKSVHSEVENKNHIVSELSSNESSVDSIEDETSSTNSCV